VKPFLTAQWLNLLNLTYRVPVGLVEPYVPAGVELDRDGGETFVSFVAFQFRNTRVRGVGIPFHRHFSEVNLRFYVRYGDQRGVVFIREFVPKAAIAAIARWIYNEPYRTIAMSSQMIVHEIVKAHYRVGPMEVDIESGTEESIPGLDSREHYFKEHHWGFGRRRNGETLVYRVDHPVWAIRPILDLKRHGSFSSLYGDTWRVLDTLEPICQIFAVGSEIAVYPACQLSECNGGL